MEIAALLRPRPRHIAYTCLAASTLAGSAIWFTWQAVDEYRRGEAATYQLANLQARRKPTAIPRAKPQNADTQRQWAALQTELSFSWYPVFRAIEESSRPDIELLEFVPDKTVHRVVLRGEARNQEALTAYADALSTQTIFSELHIVHQKVVHRAGMDVLTFEIHSVIAG